VVAGAIAKQLLAGLGIKINAWVSSVGEISLNKSYQDIDLTLTESNIVRCPDQETALLMIARIEEAGRNHDTVGGVVSGVITGVPSGWGEPVFNKLHADLGHAMLGINAVKGFEYGSGFAGIELSGSEHNDIFIKSGDHVSTLTNHSGGIQGGISNGQDIYWRVAFKPIATLLKEQKTIDKNENETTINPSGRHDPCVLPRAVPIVEAMAALVLADHYLLNRLSKL